MAAVIILLIIAIFVLYYQNIRLNRVIKRIDNDISRAEENVNCLSLKMRKLEENNASISKVNHIGHQLDMVKEDIKLTNYHIRHAVNELQETVFKDATIEEDSSRKLKLFFNDKGD